jgi:hypothetical protein
MSKRRMGKRGGEASQYGGAQGRARENMNDKEKRKLRKKMSEHLLAVAESSLKLEEGDTWLRDRVESWNIAVRDANCVEDIR